LNRGDAERIESRITVVRAADACPELVEGSKGTPIHADENQKLLAKTWYVIAIPDHSHPVQWAVCLGMELRAGLSFEIGVLW
jgi:hypothetical protein